MRHVAALVPNIAGVSPGQRVRIETWRDHLAPQGWSVDLYPFEDAALHDVLYQPGHSAEKAIRLAACYGRQMERIRRMPRPDVLFVYQEAALVGPTVLERWARRLRAPLVFDLDDPRFVPYRSPTSGRASLLKFPGKTNTLLRLADHVVAVNQLLADYAGRYNPSVTVIPNSVDTERYCPGSPVEGIPRLVWIGSHSTVANLQTIGAALGRLQADCATPIHLVGAPKGALPELNVEYRPWSAATEVRELQQCQIGLVPVAETPWNRWKFFYKTIQYMAVGLPVVAHPMGSNAEVIADGVNGFLAADPEEWYQRLRILVEDPELRGRMGAAARATAVERFSLPAHVATVARVFTEAADRGPRRAVTRLPGGGTLRG
jgi:glycosyltransferase involved in cell wall biosynthesis